MATRTKPTQVVEGDDQDQDQPVSVTESVDDLEKQVEEEDVPAEIIEMVEQGKFDFDVPGEFMDELMGAELADHLSSYQKSIPVRRAARSSGDNQRAEQLSKFINTSRLAAAQIMYKYPNAKGIADSIAHARTRQVREGRKALIDREE